MKRQDLSIFIFPKGGELGLQNNFWITDVIHLKIPKGTVRASHISLPPLY